MRVQLRCGHPGERGAPISDNTRSASVGAVRDAGVPLRTSREPGALWSHECG
jgi:hypothetical protein